MRSVRPAFLMFIVATAGCGGSVVHLPITLVTPKPATAQAETFVLTAPLLGVTSLNVYSKGAIGDVAPIVYRSFPEYASRPFAADANGEYWQTDAAQGINLGGDACEYPAGVSKHALDGTIVQQIFVDPCMTVVSASRDAKGNIFVAYGTNDGSEEFNTEPFPCDAQSSIRVAEFASTAVGQATARQEFAATTAYYTCSLYSVAETSRGMVWLAGQFLEGSPSASRPTYVPFIYEVHHEPPSLLPLHSIRLDKNATVGDVAVDSADNVYYLMNGALYRALPDGSSSQVVVAGPSVRAFTLGDGGNIIAELSTPAGAALEEYVPGRPTPSRVIAGNETRLDSIFLPIDGYNSLAAVP